MTLILIQARAKQISHDLLNQFSSAQNGPDFSPCPLIQLRDVHLVDIQYKFIFSAFLWPEMREKAGYETLRLYISQNTFYDHHYWKNEWLFNHRRVKTIE
jgi:hypothetical protein